MAWVQVYVKGLSKTIHPSDDEIESLLDERYGLSGDGSIAWAGKETTQIKRDDEGLCRGFAFLAFYSAEGALAAVDLINRYDVGTEDAQIGVNDVDYGNSSIHLPIRLSAEISKPKTSNKKKTKKDSDADFRDLRLRRQRKAPVRKHPVITSSDGKRTNLGNKTK